MSPPEWIKRIFFAPEFRHDCPSTGVTCRTLQLKHYKRAKMCNFNVDFSKIFWGLRPQTGYAPRPPYWRRATAPLPRPHPPRRSGASRLARDLRSLHRRVWSPKNSLYYTMTGCYNYCVYSYALPVAACSFLFVIARWRHYW